MFCNVEFLFTSLCGRSVMVDMCRILTVYIYTNTLTHCNVMLCYWTVLYTLWWSCSAELFEGITTNITLEKIWNELYGVFLKNYSRQTADDHEYLAGLDWKLTEFWSSALSRTTLLLCWHCDGLWITQFWKHLLENPIYVFYPECKLFSFNRKKFSNIDVVLPLVVFQCTLTAKVRVLWLQRTSKPIAWSLSHYKRKNVQLVWDLNPPYVFTVLHELKFSLKHNGLRITDWYGRNM